MTTITDFIWDDFMEESYHIEPTTHTVEELAPYWDEFLADCKRMGREVPKGLTVEIYVSAWNDLVMKKGA